MGFYWRICPNFEQNQVNRRGDWASTRSTYFIIHITAHRRNRNFPDGRGGRPYPPGTVAPPFPRSHSEGKLKCYHFFHEICSSSRTLPVRRPDYVHVCSLDYLGIWLHKNYILRQQATSNNCSIVMKCPNCQSGFTNRKHFAFGKDLPLWTSLYFCSHYDAIS